MRHETSLTQAASPARRPERRAPAMSVEQRRAAIIEVALPLLVEQGANVTTSQIAAAAGIAEGTVFRAFRDKNELLKACMRAAVDSEEEIRRIESIDRSLPLADRLVLAVAHVGDFQTRVWSVIQALQAAGLHQEREDFGEEDDKPDSPPNVVVKVITAIEELFDTGADNLGVAPATAAELLLGLTFANRISRDDNAITDVAQLVDLFLHGVLHSTTGGRERT